MDQIAWVIVFQNLGLWLQPLMSFISTLGTEQFYLLVMPWIFWCVDATIGLQFALLLLVSSALNAYLKFIFHAPRPFWVDSRVQALAVETSFGIPSGHAQNAASLWGFGAVLIKNKAVKWLIGLIILAIGISRVYLGVHFVGDVIVGWLVGAILLWVFLRIAPRISKWWVTLSVTGQLAMAVLSSVAIPVIGWGFTMIFRTWRLPEEWVTIAQSKIGLIHLHPFSLEGLVTVAGTWLGALVGWIICTHQWKSYPSGGTLAQRVLRYSIGLVGLGVFYAGLGMVFGQLLSALGGSSEGLFAMALRYFRYGIVGVWVTAGAPWIFKMLRLYGAEGG
ncbi:phosphatase PAP2 family protein [uncultured Thermanaerothrix sp.]|uniref:phosphatase PAP2 family protein n=1 Tax=uncultured Thermanaerothrix sp. TaxID=1195149 RepID=UPI00261D7270|nr:phosphatase PAP2 family protein [uncultured Thermanaerothrix sp.]